MHAIGEQGRGERVARESFIRSAIEGKAQTLMAVDAPAGGRAPLAAWVHDRTPGGDSPVL